MNHRDYTELAVLSPQVTKSPNGGLSFAGQHDRYNSIQIDGTNNNDPFGRSFSGNGTPGWAVGLTAFTPEAVKELQVVSAPFDVRYGGFAGGLINAVTRSGTNRVEGSILGYFENADLTGTDSTGNRASEFSRKELGLTLGAPIVRDRVAVFVNAALREEVIPQSVPVPTSDTTGGADSAGVGIRYESLVRFQDLLRNYGVEPGTFSAGAYQLPPAISSSRSRRNSGLNSRLAVSHNYGHGNVRDEIRGPVDRTPMPLSSSGGENPETINATRLAWTTAFGGRFSNELIVARVDDRRNCFPTSDFPAVSVQADGGELFAGSCRQLPRARDRAYHLGDDRQLRHGGGKPPAHLRDPCRTDRPGGRRAGGFPAASGPSTAWTRWHRAKRRATSRTAHRRRTPRWRSA